MITGCIGGSSITWLRPTRRPPVLLCCIAIATGATSASASRPSSKPPDRAATTYDRASLNQDELLTKTNYGVLLALALATAFAIDGRWLSRPPVGAGSRAEPRALAVAATRRGQGLTALVFGLPLALWLAYPEKVLTTLSALTNVPLGPDRFSIEGLLFYPRALLWLAGSWPLLLVWLASLALTLRWHLPCSDPRLRLVVILLGLQALVAELAVTKVDRHILPLGLGFSLLVGFWAARLCRRGRLLGRPASGPGAARAGRWSAALGATALLLWQLRGLGPAAPSGTSTGPSPLLEFLADDVRERGPALVVGSIGLEETPAAIDWHLAV